MRNWFSPCSAFSGGSTPPNQHICSYLVHLRVLVEISGILAKILHFCSHFCRNQPTFGEICVTKAWGGVLKRLCKGLRGLSSAYNKCWNPLKYAPQKRGIFEFVPPIHSSLRNFWQNVLSKSILYTLSFHLRSLKYSQHAYILLSDLGGRFGDSL